MASTGDPVADLILSGEADSLDAAEELNLERRLHDVAALVESPISDEGSCRHPLLALRLARGSRGFEDSLV